MIGEVFDTVLCVVGGVVWFQGHTVVAHSVGAMFAKPSVAAWDLSVLTTPILVDLVLFGDFPWSSTSGVGF